MTDTAARIRYVYIRTYAGQRPPDEFIAHAATIRGRLLFFCARATCGYYSMCGYYSNKYGMSSCLSLIENYTPDFKHCACGLSRDGQLLKKINCHKWHPKFS